MATDNELQQQMDELRQAVQGLAAASQDAEKGLEAFGKATWKGVKSIGPGLGSLAKTVGEGDTSFKSMNKVVDIAANALGGMAKAIPFAGDALSATLKATAEAAKFLLDQMDQTTKSFNSMAEVGALTADGMQGVLDQSNASGLVLASWTKLVQTNSMALARMSGIAGDGAKVFSEAVGKLTQGNDDSLRMLGMNAEQIGETVGAFASQQTRLGRSQNMTADQLMLGAKQYAMDLDKLQKITGMSREAIQKQQDSVLSESRFRANYETLLAEGKTDEAAALMNLQTRMSSYDKELGQGVRDLVSGAANTEASAQLMKATNGAAQDIVNRMKFDGLSAGEAEEELRQAMLLNKETMLQHAKVVDGNSDAYGNVSGKMDFMNKKVAKSDEVAEATQEAQLAATNKLTKDTIEAQKSIERMGKEVQKMTMAALPYAATAVKHVSSALEGLTKFINAMIGGEDTGAAAVEPGSTGTGMDMGGSEIMAAAGTTASQKDLAKMGLKIKEGDVQASGAQISTQLIEMAKKVQATVPGFAYFSGFNDKFHQEKSPSSSHTTGRAMDFALASPPSPEEGEKIVGMLKNMGASLAIDEYNNPSSKATAGHIHAQVSAASGAVLSGPSGGYSPGLTMHGTEAIVPLDTPESSPMNFGGGNTEMMTMQLARLEELASIFKSQLSVDQKLLQYSS